MSTPAGSDLLTSPATALRTLTDPDAGELLAAAVATAGGRLLRWHATHVDHRPGRSTTVAYRARVAWPDGERDETLGASAGFPTDGDHSGVLVLSDGGLEVAVWCVPADPGLPALPLATDRAAAGAVLATVGLAPPGIAADDVAVRIRSYRPRRRAVVEVRTPTGHAFLKVVRPDRVADLHRRHRLLSKAGVPVPTPLGWSDDGLLVLEALGGSPLRGRLRRLGPAAVDAAEVRRTLDALPDALLELPPRASWTDGAAHYAAVLAAAVPGEADRAADLARAVADGVAACDEPVVPVHGDLYEAQLLVARRRVSGVLDVDSAGPGRRSDDAGCLLAHAAVLTQVWPDAAPLLDAAVEAWFPVLAADPWTTPDAVRLRTAGVLLSLATGPHRVQHEGWAEATTSRLDLVERWLEARPGTPPRRP